jgi:hypothetical protein
MKLRVLLCARAERTLSFASKDHWPTMHDTSFVLRGGSGAIVFQTVGAQPRIVLSLMRPSGCFCLPIVGITLLHQQLAISPDK